MTLEWLIFSLFVPAAIAALGWLAVLVHERQLRRDARRGDLPPAE